MPRHASQRAVASRRRPLIVALAAVFLFGPGVAFVAGVRPHAFENHALAKLPSFSTGWSAFPALPQWAIDHLPLRQQAVRWDGSLNTALFGDPAVPPGSAGAAPESGGRMPATVGQPLYPLVILGKDGTEFFGGDFSQACSPIASADLIMSRLDQLAGMVRASGRTFLAVVPPDKSTAEPQFLPSDFSGTACVNARNALFWPRLDALDYVLDVRPALSQLAGQIPWPVYRPTDTHWDGPGAALMVSQIVSRLDPAVASVLHPTDAGTISYVGDLTTLAGNPAGAPLHRVSLHAPGVTITPTQSGMLGPRSYLLRSSGPAGTVVTAPTIILSDSFTEAALPSLPGVFAHLLVIEQNYFSDEAQQLIDQIVQARNVVLETVQRDFFSGSAILLDPNFLGQLQAALAAHPLR